MGGQRIRCPLCLELFLASDTDEAPTRQNVASSLEAAKQVLAADEEVLYGIFGMIGVSGSFPPRTFLNEFLMRDSDPCDQDGRMSDWQPFAMSPEEYGELKVWWMAGHPGAVEDSLGVENWDDWVQEVLNHREP
jgi:hypothetical protein